MAKQPPKQPQKKTTTVVALPDPGTIKKFFQEIKLALYLMGDRRVPFLLKLLPIGGVMYVLWPFDPIPVLGMTPLDDAAALWAGIHYFVELSPPHVVQHYRDILEGKVTRVKGKPTATDINPDDVVDGEFRPVDDVVSDNDTDKGEDGQEYDWSKFA